MARIPQPVTAAVDASAGARPGPWASLGLGAAAFFAAVVPMVLVLQFTDWWYGFFELTDLTRYHQYASNLDRGLRPFVDFTAEYPPLALRLFAFPGHPGDVDRYVPAFAALMLLALLAAAVLVADTAARCWPARSGAVLVAGTFGVALLALGSIVANRYDAVVALLLALFLWAVTSRRWLLAALAIGAGTAFKLTPAVLLPVLLVLVEDARKRWWAVAVFIAAAAGPFVVEGPGALRGLAEVFAYHGSRPLQAESVLATPLLLAHLAGLVTARTGNSFGSQFIDAPGAGLLAAASGPLAVGALALVYRQVWRRREALRQDLTLAPLVTVVVLLALLVPAKVLSPQYLVWLLPSCALLAPGARGLSVALLAIFAATQVEFPGLYWDFVDLKPGPVLLVVARNLALCGALALGVAKLAKTVTPPA